MVWYVSDAKLLRRFGGRNTLLFSLSIQDNAASGGFSGFSFPVLPEPIGVRVGWRGACVQNDYESDHPRR